MSPWSRRELLGALAALTALAAVPARATELPEDVEAERQELLAHVRDAVLGFDVLQLALEVLAELDAPPRLLEELTSVIGDRDTSGGFATVQRWMDDGPLSSELRALGARWTDKLSIKLKLVRLVKQAPTTPEGRHAVLEHVLVQWMGLDMARLRAHVAAYPEGGLAVTYGPVTSWMELAGLILSEPFALYLGLAHGRRPTVRTVTGDDPIRAMLDVILDPEVRVLALTGHGSWTSFSLSGWALEPDAAWADLCDRASRDPKGLLKTAARGHLYYLLGGGGYRGSFGEESLAELLDALPEERRTTARKDLVVRHTCGSERYELDSSSWLLKLLPDELRQRLHVGSEGFSGAAPRDAGTYEQELGDWLGQTRATVTERPALGTCLVASPDRTRGYEGISWLPDFVADPIPEPIAVAPFAAPEPWIDPDSPWGPLTDSEG